MSTERLHYTTPCVFLLSDRQVTHCDQFRTTDDLRQASALWVIEHVQPVDSVEAQQQAAQSGTEIVVCSFLRRTAQEISPCQVYLGSLASISAAAGMTVHCEQDLVRAARELRGRLRARTVAAAHGGKLHVITASGAHTRPVAGKSVVDMIKTASEPASMRISVA